MKTRFRSRTLMIVIALLAVALATPGELRRRRERRHFARVVAHCSRVALEHDRWRAECERADGEWYDSITRQWALGSISGVPTFADWRDEALWHTRRAEELRASADEFRRKESAVRSQLLLPVILDVRS